MNNLTTGQKLKVFRVRSRVSQLELEMAIEMSPGSLSRIENGKINPSKETILKIAKALDLNCFETASLFGIEIDLKDTNVSNYSLQI